MKVIVFGASGNVGRRVVELLLQQHHAVTAFVHGASPFSDTPNLQVIRGDIHNSQDVATAIQGHQAVISALGSWGTPTKDIVSSGMRAIIPAMTAQNIQRIISLTGAAAIVPHQKTRLIDTINRFILSKIAPKILRDGELHIELLAQSSLDWTVVRSPVMKATGSADYTLQHTSISPLATIPRIAVATAMVTLLQSQDYSRTAPYISRR